MIGERDVRYWGGTDRSDVGVEVMADRHLVEVRERHIIKALIVISDVDGKQSPNVGQVDGHTLRQQCRPVLAEQVHLMSQTSQRPHQVGVVDVATGAAQQVAVENEDPHSVAAIPRVTVGQMRVTSKRKRPQVKLQTTSFGETKPNFSMITWDVVEETAVAQPPKGKGIYLHNDFAVRRALEDAGVEFIDENGGGPGLRLRKGQRAKKPK